jgi:hypothetical protein
MEIVETVLPNGNREWRLGLNGNLHRDDGPALIDVHGNQFWYQNDKLHRDNDLPAFIQKNGDQYWYRNGKCHRDNDLPAVVNANGDQEWWKNGERHRDNGPAVIQVYGLKVWFQNGVFIKETTEIISRIKSSRSAK